MEEKQLKGIDGGSEKDISERLKNEIGFQILKNPEYGLAYDHWLVSKGHKPGDYSKIDLFEVYLTTNKKTIEDYISENKAGLIEAAQARESEAAKELLNVLKSKNELGKSLYNKYTGGDDLSKKYNTLERLISYLANTSFMKKVFPNLAETYPKKLEQKYREKVIARIDKELEEDIKKSTDYKKKIEEDIISMEQQIEKMMNEKEHNLTEIELGKKIYYGLKDKLKYLVDNKREIKTKLVDLKVENKNLEALGLNDEVSRARYAQNEKAIKELDEYEKQLSSRIKGCVREIQKSKRNIEEKIDVVEGLNSDIVDTTCQISDRQKEEEIQYEIARSFNAIKKNYDNFVTRKERLDINLLTEQQDKLSGYRISTREISSFEADLSSDLAKIKPTAFRIEIYSNPQKKAMQERVNQQDAEFEAKLTEFEAKEEKLSNVDIF